MIENKLLSISFLQKRFAKHILHMTLFCALICMTSCEKESEITSGSTGVWSRNTGETSVTGNVTDLTSMSATITSWANFSFFSIGDNEIGILIGRSENLEQEYENRYYSKSMAKDNSYTIMVKGLVPDAEYYYCSFARQNGIYEYGNVKSFRTPKTDFKISVDLDYVDAGSCRGTIRYDLGNVRYDSFEVKIDCPRTIVRGGVIEMSQNSAKFSFVDIPYKQENVLIPYLVIDGQSFYGEEVKVHTKDFSYNGVKVSASFEHYKIKLRFESSLAQSDNIKYGIMHCTVGGENSLVSYIDESESRNGNILEGSFIPIADSPDDAFKVGLYLSSISYFEEKIHSGSDTREDDEAYEKLKGLVEDYLEKIVDKHYYAVAFVKVDGIFYKIGYYSIDESETLGYPNIRKAEDNPIDPASVSYDEFVDLGLSVKWATCNLGATKPEEDGDYFAWGETTPKSNYSWSTLKYCTEGFRDENVKFSKYVASSTYGPVDKKTRLDLSDDTARANLGGSWRMPTDVEFQELIEKCNLTYTSVNGKNGCKVTSKLNGNSIFLPAASWCYGTSGPVGSSFEFRNEGVYWSSSLDERDSRCAHNVYINVQSEFLNVQDLFRSFGVSVRPVLEK